MTSFTYAIVVVSDRGSRGEREDKSAPVVRDLLERIGGKIAGYKVVPDELEEIREAILQWTEGARRVDLVLTCGGTGVHPRDVTPEATRGVIQREVPGIPEAMRAASLSKTPHAVLSRGIAGVKDTTLIINLPGSPKAAKENLEAILVAIPHALEKIQGDPSECGSQG